MTKEQLALMTSEQLQKLEDDLWLAANHLPETYDRKKFKEKADNVFGMILEVAKKHIKWVA